MHFATFRHEGLNSAVMITWKNKISSFSIIWKHLEKHQINTIDKSQNISNSLC